MYNFEDEPNWTSMRRALTAGNPDAIIAFSPGVKPFICTQGGSDFTGGESAHAFEVGKWRKVPQLSLDPTPEEVDGAQYHVLTFLGKFWGDGEPRFPDAFVGGGMGSTLYTVHWWVVPGTSMSKPRFNELERGKPVKTCPEFSEGSESMIFAGCAKRRFGLVAGHSVQSNSELRADYGTEG